MVSNLSLVTALTICISYILHRLKRKRAEKYFQRQHGCGAPRRLQRRWPLAIDTVLDAFRHFEEKQVLQWFVEIFERTGPTFEQDVLGSKDINTVEPDNIESILSTKFSDYGLGARRPMFAPLLGDGIFTQDAAPWKHSREMLRPLFSLNRARVFTQIEEHTDRLVNCIPTGQLVDLQPLFFQFTFDTTTFLLFGKSTNSLEATPTLTQNNARTREAKFSEAFRISQDYLFRRGRLGGLYWLVGGREFHKQCSIVHRFIDEAVQEVLSNEPGEDEILETHSFLDALVQETRDPRVLRDQLLNVMLAGRDTTACCLTWTFRLLAQHPHVLAKLWAEVSFVLGVGKEATMPDRNSLKKLKFLNLVLKEVLRLYPSVPINSRTALQTTTLPSGGGPDGTKSIMIRKGQAVGYSVYAMHRLKKLYGDDSESFRPERWDPAVENAVDLRKIGWGYLPFNGGPRVCLGQEFALLEAGYVVVRMLQKFRTFELDPSEGGTIVGAEQQEVTLVVGSTKGCRVKAFE